ncbi:hypothetical protein EDB89DRAFT_1905783 [Lactarius sanguifluus]|nr:hypothetical protein EDB89DRAFT_1905783 [Lactarius sanguifluus]
MHSTTTNDALAKRLAQQYRTKGEGMTRANELLLIAALFARHAQLPYEARQHPVRANGTQVSNSTNKNRYALLDPDTACDDIPEKTTTHGWTVVTHKRKPQKEITTTSCRGNARTEVEVRVDESTYGDAEVEAYADQRCQRVITKRVYSRKVNIILQYCRSQSVSVPLSEPIAGVSRRSIIGSSWSSPWSSLLLAIAPLSQVDGRFPVVVIDWWWSTGIAQSSWSMGNGHWPVVVPSPSSPRPIAVAGVVVVAAAG